MPGTCSSKPTLIIKEQDHQDEESKSELKEASHSLPSFSLINERLFATAAHKTVDRKIHGRQYEQERLEDNAKREEREIERERVRFRID